jgi:putative Mg2+ transporter-C (MgtC) family protein
MVIDWNLILRLVLGGLMGGLIGLEREMRAKGAGIRTHFIVGLGSALFMIISMYAFEGTARFDSSRVAAGVVSGIGFIGGGVIIFQRNVIRGITTAAGMWVAAAIGLACGAGMYPIAVAATLLTLLVLELLHFFHLRYGEKMVEMTLSSKEGKDLLSALDILKEHGANVDSYSLNDGKLQLSLRLKLRDYLDKVGQLSKALDGFRIEAMN